MAMNVNSNLDAFKRALNVTADGKFKTDAAHTKGQLYLDADGAVKSVNRHFNITRLKNTEVNYNTRLALLNAFSNATAPEAFKAAFLERASTLLGLNPDQSVDGDLIGIANKPLSRREAKQLITAFETGAAEARFKPELEQHFTLGTAKAKGSNLEFETVENLGVTVENPVRADLPESLMKACAKYSIPVDSMNRAYRLELATTGKSAQEIAAEVNEKGDNVPMVRLAHNPQFLMDETSYLEGKAACDKFKYTTNTKKECLDKFSHPDRNVWACNEQSRLSNKCCEIIRHDKTVQDENAAFLAKFGLKPTSKAGAFVLNRMNSCSALIGRDKYNKVIYEQTNYHLGSPNDADGEKVSQEVLLKRHLVPHPMPSPSNYALAKLVKPLFLEKMMAALEKANLNDDQMSVFLSRVFSKMAFSNDGIHQILQDEINNSDPEKHEANLKRFNESVEKLEKRLAEYVQEAKDVCEVFTGEAERANFCNAMNRDITTVDFRGKAMTRSEIEGLKAMVGGYEAWALTMKFAGEAFGAQDLKNLVNIVYGHSDGVGKRFPAVNEIALNMAKLSGVFKCEEGDPDVFAPLRDTKAHEELLNGLFEEFAARHTNDLEEQKQAAEESKDKKGKFVVTDKNVEVVRQLKMDAIEMNRLGGFYKSMVGIVLQPDDEFAMMDAEAVLTDQDIRSDCFVTDEMSEKPFPNFKEDDRIPCTFGHTYEVELGCELALEAYEKQHAL